MAPRQENTIVEPLSQSELYLTGSQKDVTIIENITCVVYLILGTNVSKVCFLFRPRLFSLSAQLLGARGRPI